MGTAVLLGAELLLPLVIFSSRQLRLYGCGGIVLLQVLAAISGNAGLYNWLIMVLAVLLLDDEILPLRWRGKWCAGAHLVRPRHWQLAQNGVHLALCLCILSVSGLRLIRQIEGAVKHDPTDVLFRGPALIAGPGCHALAVRNRGLVRDADGGERRPACPGHRRQCGRGGLAALHVRPPSRSGRPASGLDRPFDPRLDWELAQAAGGSLKDSRIRRWFVPFLVRLLEGEPAVLAQLGANPFPDRPPRYLRVLVYRYEFTSGSERRSTGAWWRRSLIRVFCPPVNLDRLLPVLEHIRRPGQPESAEPAV